MTIDQMRLSYTLAGLAEADLAADPLQQFQTWFQQAGADDKPEWLEINAMTLATADLSGRVTSRIVLLKGIEDGKFLFFTNYQSEKANQMAANPSVSLCFYWPHLQRQVRINGTITKTSREASESYFATRPRGSRLGAILSQQSQAIDGRHHLEQQLQTLEAQYLGRDDIPCPENWGGYAVDPKEIEFWQGRESRLHDRLMYRKTPNGWKIVRLSP
jgi:pyridoxamine 5'-phosphate oxidase